MLAGSRCGRLMVMVGAVMVPLAVGACAPTHGVDVYNATGQVISVEMLSHDPNGEMTTYGSATINRDASFVNSMEAPVRGQSMRARFRVEGESLAEENWVMVNLPGKTMRYYQLEMVDGRLKAVEQKRGRPESAKTSE